MRTVLRYLFGISADALPADAKIEFVWADAPHSWRVFLFLGICVALCVAVVRIYRRDAAQCGPGWRRILTGCRLAVLGILLLMWLGPNLGIRLRRTLEPWVIVLVDNSLSMSLPDVYNDQAAAEAAAQFLDTSVADLRQQAPARMELVNRLLNADQEQFLRQLTTRGRVQVVSFSDQLTVRKVRGIETAAPVPGTEEAQPQGPPLPPLNAEGTSTNLARALRESLAAAAGTPVAATVVISDGRHTGFEDPLEAAAEFEQRGIPLFTVGVGDPEEPRNLRMRSVWAPETVPRHDPFKVEAVLEVRGMQPGNLSFELLQQSDPEAEPAVVERQEVVLPEASDTVTVSFTVTPAEAGAYRYFVKTPVLEGEILRTDNISSTPVEVLDQQVRVLMVAGAPTWEQRFLRAFLVRDRTINLSVWLQSQDPRMPQDGNTVIDSLPITAEDLYEYDAVILMDPDPNEVPPEWFDLLTDFSGKHGGGVMWVAGTKYSLHFFRLPRSESVRRLLPVRLENLLTVSTRTNIYDRAWPLQLAPAGVDHPWLDIARDPEQNRALWEALPGMYRSSPANGAKPGTRVLIEHSSTSLLQDTEALPLLVTGQFGPGKVVFMGFDETWRWRQSSLELYHQYWIRAVREIVSGRRLRGRGRGEITTDRSSYGVGDRIRVTARLFDAAYQPLQKDSAPAVLRSASGSEQGVSLKPVLNQPGQYEAVFTARQLGGNRLEVAVPGAPGQPGAVLTHEFMVTLPNVEMQEPNLNRDLLEQLAGLTGGQYLLVNDTGKIASAVPDRSETVIIEGSPIPLWDNARVLLLLVALLAVEWIVRKRCKLI